MTRMVLSIIDTSISGVLATLAAQGLLWLLELPLILLMFNQTMSLLFFHPTPLVRRAKRRLNELVINIGILL